MTSVEALKAERERVLLKIILSTSLNKEHFTTQLLESMVVSSFYNNTEKRLATALLDLDKGIVVLEKTKRKADMSLFLEEHVKDIRQYRVHYYVLRKYTTLKQLMPYYDKAFETYDDAHDAWLKLNKVTSSYRLEGVIRRGHVL